MKKSFLMLFLVSVASLPAHAERNLSYHFDFGTWFGGDTLAQNPDGDNYKAGSGAVFGLGLEWLFNPQHKISLRNNLGYRYQGAKTGNGGNRGIVYESALVKHLGKVNLAAGIHLDLNAVTKDFYGNRLEYKTALGQYVTIEHMTFETWGFGLKYLFQDYQLSNETTVSGNQFGLFLTGRF